MTATDPICGALELACQYPIPAATRAPSTTLATAAQYLRPEAASAATGSAAIGMPDAEEATCDMASAGRAPDEEDAANTSEGGVTPVAPLPATELFPESISRFKRFRSARISDATW